MHLPDLASASSRWQANRISIEAYGFGAKRVGFHNFTDMLFCWRTS